MTTHTEPQAITLQNYRYQSTDALEAKLTEMESLPISEWHLITDDALEAAEELSDAIYAELNERELEASLPGPDEYDSLEDRGLSLGSYAS